MLNNKYGAYGEVKVTHSNVHDYLGMTFDFSDKGKVKVVMVDYIENMIDDFSVKLKMGETAPTPATEDLFSVGPDDPLPKAQAEEFHTFVAKGLFACKQARLDVHPTVAVLCT